MLVSFNSAEAASVYWNKNTQDTFFGLEVAGQTWLSWPGFQIGYHAHAIDKKTGGVIACGASVPAGTDVSFSFYPKRDIDIAWAGLGGINDTPYGRWGNGASRSGGGSICSSKYNIKYRKINQNMGVWTKQYVDYVVHPPTRTISGLPAGQCTKLGNGNYDCKTDTPGVLNATFNFGSTYSRFYEGWQANGSCVGGLGNIPLRKMRPNTRLVLTRAGIVFQNSSPADANITVPAQRIHCPITILPNPNTATPAKPTIIGPNSCLNESASYRTVTAGPAALKVRYLIDWNNDSTIDQIYPPTTFVSAGVPQTIQYLWGSTGEKRFKVTTQSQSGILSAPAVKNVTIVDCDIEQPPVSPPTTPPSTLPPGVDDDPGVVFPTEPLTPTTTPSLTEKVAGIDYPDGEIAFIFDPKITNTMCTAYWSTRYVENCKFYKGTTELDGELDISGELDLEPGLYSLKCEQWKDGTIISEESLCKRNIDFREI